MYKDELFIINKSNNLFLPSYTVGIIYYISSSMALQTHNLNRFYIMPTVMKGSVCSFTNLINLSEESEIVCSGEVERLENGNSFLINGDCTIEIVPKSEAFSTMRLRRPNRTFSNGLQNDYDWEV